MKFDWYINMIELPHTFSILEPAPARKQLCFDVIHKMIDITPQILSKLFTGDTKLTNSTQEILHKPNFDIGLLSDLHAKWNRFIHRNPTSLVIKTVQRSFTLNLARLS